MTDSRYPDACIEEANKIIDLIRSEFTEDSEKSRIFPALIFSGNFPKSDTLPPNNTLLNVYTKSFYCPRKEDQFPNRGSQSYDSQFGYVSLRLIHYKRAHTLGFLYTREVLRPLPPFTRDDLSPKKLLSSTGIVYVYRNDHFSFLSRLPNRFASRYGKFLGGKVLPIPTRTIDTVYVMRINWDRIKAAQSDLVAKEVKKVLVEKELSFYPGRAIIKFQNGKEIDIGNQSRCYFFLLYLFQNRGEYKDYGEIGDFIIDKLKKSKVCTSKGKKDNIYIYQDLYGVKYGLKTFCRQAGMGEKEFDRYIHTKKGYKLEYIPAEE
ncbi:hypothetical protein JW710_02010 [Candidatus Dojkabacteria bacterium]|nr:hypothetical protein [Candidatus Dojkabacteria bacterium]